MDQTEEQEEYNQQKTKGNGSLENEVENLTERFHGMDEKLNTLANLIADIGAQAREAKCKYESGTSDSRGKKIARTYVGVYLLILLSQGPMALVTNKRKMMMTL